MFYDNFMLLCEKNQIRPYTALKNIGIESKSILSRWRAGATPRPATIEMIADYFGVTPEELLFGIKKEPSIPKDEELDKNDAISNLRDNVLYHFPDATPQDVSALMNAIEGTDLTVQELIRIAEMFKRMSPADRKFVTGIFEAYTEAK